MNPSNTLDQFVRRARHLYTLPAVAMKVIELTGNLTVDVQALKCCIENDPALTTKILRVVNSSLFGLTREVSDLNQALALLGTQPLKLLVLGLSLPDDLFANIASDVLARYWRQALTKAVAAREISEHVCKKPGDEVFIAGLLQDLGMLVLLQDLGRPYVQLVTNACHQGVDLRALEYAMLGFDHTELTARLLDHWGLPEQLVQAVRMPTDGEQPQLVPPDQWHLSHILQLAGLFARLVDQKRAEVLAELLAITHQNPCFAQHPLGALIQVIQEKVLQLADVLSLQLPRGLNYSDILARAHVQLAELADEAAGSLAQNSRQVETPREIIESLTAAVDELAQRATSCDTVAGVSSTSSGPAVQTGSHLEARPDDVDPGLLGRLTGAVSTCRQARCALSLLLIEIDDFEDLVVTRGLGGVAELVGILERFVKTSPGGVLLQTTDARFAAVLEDCDRQQAVEFAKALVQHVRHGSRLRVETGVAAMSISAGVATVTLPPRNLPVRKLVEAASRCLYASGALGGDGVKSIDIC